jgi:hypothetical protein
MLQIGFPEGRIGGLIEYFEAVNSGGYEDVDINDFEVITGKKPTSVGSWVQRYASLFK